MCKSPLSLSDFQLRLIQDAAKTISVEGRDEFLRAVAAHLGSEPTDAAVLCAIDAQLSIGRLPVFLCDSKREDGDHPSSSPDKTTSHDEKSFSHSARERAEQHFNPRSNQ